MNANLLDLNTYILNIIGDHVKNDNYYRIKQEKFEERILKYVDSKVREIKRKSISKIDYL
jgi:hypothetical protein